MPTEEYREKMIQTFLDTGCDELIALVALPTEDGFAQLKSLLEREYKKKALVK